MVVWGRQNEHDTACHNFRRNLAREAKRQHMGALKENRINDHEHDQGKHDWLSHGGAEDACPCFTRDAIVFSFNAQLDSGPNKG